MIYSTNPTNRRLVQAAKEAGIKSQFASAQAYHAQIILKKDDRGDSLVDKVVLTQRKN